MNGEITFQTLIRISKGKFNGGKDKFVNFHLIPKLLTSSTQVVYYTKPVKKVNCALLIYDVINQAYIHLGIDKISEGTYIARTFLIEPITDVNQVLHTLKVKVPPFRS
jgi:hypothetical protein